MSSHSSASSSSTAQTPSTSRCGRGVQPAVLPPPPGSIRRPPPFPPARSHQLAVSPARFMSGELKATECGCGAVPGKAGRGRLERGRASGLVGPPGGARRPWPRRPRHADPGRGGGGRVGARGGSGHCWPRGAVVRARTRGAVSGRSGSCRPRPVCSQKGMPSNVDIIWVRRLNEHGRAHYFRV